MADRPLFIEMHSGSMNEPSGKSAHPGGQILHSSR